MSHSFLCLPLRSCTLATVTARVYRWVDKDGGMARSARTTGATKADPKSQRRARFRKWHRSGTGSRRNRCDQSKELDKRRRIRQKSNEQSRRTKRTLDPPMPQKPALRRAR